MMRPDGGGEERSRRRARRWYRRLLRLYPAAFRKRFGAEMEESFLHLLEMEGRRHGWIGRVGPWARAAWDAAMAGTARRARQTTKGRRGEGTGPSPMDDGTGGRELMSSLIADARFAARALLRRPLLATTAALTLGGPRPRSSPSSTGSS